MSSSSGSSSKLTYPLLPAVSSHTGRKAAWASFTKWSVSPQAISSSSSPLPTASAMLSLNAPALMMSATMIGLLVAPVAPAARFFFTSGGSIESSQTLVPVAISDFSDMGVSPFGGSVCEGRMVVDLAAVGNRRRFPTRPGPGRTGGPVRRSRNPARSRAEFSGPGNLKGGAGERRPGPGMANRWIVSQVGARQHYGVPRGLHGAGLLRQLYTDCWAGRGRRWLRRGPRAARAMASRYHPDLPPPAVVSFNGRAVWDAVRQRAAVGRGPGAAERQYRQWVRVGSGFASAVAADLARRPLDPDRDVFLGFDTACLETLRLTNDHGLLSICDQIDPARVEDAVVRAEADRWPGWLRRPLTPVPDLYWDRLAAEWAAASVVLVNSEWSRSALLAQGVPAAKVAVLPPPYEAPRPAPRPRRSADDRLTVLWLGTVCLRKGIPYLLDAARRLAKSHPRVDVVVAGRLDVSDAAVATAPGNVRFVGRVDRDRAEAWYRRADLFVLPTLSDGFAVTQLEAMAQGLPVIATPNCGRVVTPGGDGLIVPPADGDALAAAIASLDDDRERLWDMGRQAVAKSAQFHLRQHARRLEQLVADCRRRDARAESRASSPTPRVVCA